MLQLPCSRLTDGHNYSAFTRIMQHKVFTKTGVGARFDELRYQYHCFYLSFPFALHLFNVYSLELFLDIWHIVRGGLAMARSAMLFG